jgi:hypothetical protein
VQLLNSSSRNALVPVLPLSPENSQNPPHPADIHPAYRIGYMQLLHTLHNATSPQSSLHGKLFRDAVQLTSLKALVVIAMTSPMATNILLNVMSFFHLHSQHFLFLFTTQVQHFPPRICRMQRLWEFHMLLPSIASRMMSIWSA